MLPMRQLETFLERVPENFQGIVFELRNIIASVAPDAVEAVRWGGLSYFHEGRGGIVSAGICQIGIQEDHVRLSLFTARSCPIRVIFWKARKNTNGLSGSSRMRMHRGII